MLQGTGPGYYGNRMMFRITVFFAIAAAPILADPVDKALLQRVREHMAAYLSQLTNYTCHVDINRLRRNSTRAKLEPVDRLRLEVAFVSGKELYALKGSESFEDNTIDRLTGGTGAMSTGSYA